MLKLTKAQASKLSRAGTSKKIVGQPRVSAQYLADRVQQPGRGRRGRPANKDWYHPSKPGEFPHKDTGHLRRNINEEEDLKLDASNSTVRVGTNVPYAAILELKKNRLLFRETLTREMSRLQLILEQGKVI